MTAAAEPRSFVRVFMHRSPPLLALPCCPGLGLADPPWTATAAAASGPHGEARVPLLQRPSWCRRRGPALHRDHRRAVPRLLRGRAPAPPHARDAQAAAATWRLRARSPQSAAARDVLPLLSPCRTCDGRPAGQSRLQAARSARPAACSLRPGSQGGKWWLGDPSHCNGCLAAIGPVSRSQYN